AGVLAPIGFILPMEIGALLMSASTVVVALNAQLLRRLDLRPQQTISRLDPVSHPSPTGDQEVHSSGPETMARG
ncbi:MAG: hypothetical protein ABI632_01050, partial [Pseudolysinimonas sp.]